MKNVLNLIMIYCGSDDIYFSEREDIKYTLHDIRTMATMGKYYTHKIAGSTNMALHHETKDKK